MKWAGKFPSNYADAEFSFHVSLMASPSLAQVRMVAVKVFGLSLGVMNRFELLL